MHATDAPAGRLPCVWMSAGLVSYRLCDREYDCERCPLDAALRGGGGTAGPAKARSRPSSAGPAGFPEDRLYGGGHTWVEGPVPPGRDETRVGLDAFAAALLAAPRAVRGAPPGARLAAGDTACELELPGGVLALATPLAGTLVRLNPACRDDPALPLADPYGAGWLFALATPPPAPGDELFAAAEARRRAGHDLRRFRRRVALELLAGDDEVGPTLADGGEPLLDLPALLGARGHLLLLRDLIH